MMRCPEWLKDWMEPLRRLRDPYTIDLNLDAFDAKGGAGLPVLQLRVPVGAGLKGPIRHAFRFELVKGDVAIRTFGVGWRKDPGTINVGRLSADADRFEGESNWLMEIGLGSEHRGPRVPGRVAYRALYQHLRERGKALKVDDPRRLLMVRRFMLQLGFDLEFPLDDQERPVPVLFDESSSPDRWTDAVLKAAVVRATLAGLLGSAKWEPDARQILGFTGPDGIVDFGTFRRTRRWGFKARDQRALERDLEKHFGKWVEAQQVGLVCLDKWSRPEVFDGQIPDVLLALQGEEGAFPAVVVEAKLGISRSDFRTGLTQAREYRHHAHRWSTGADVPTILLLGASPEQLGFEFAGFVAAASHELSVGVAYEDRDGFKLWRGAPVPPATCEPVRKLLLALGARPN